MAQKKKRFYQPKDRAKFPEYYAGMSERRKQEREDENMIHEDRNAMANLPQQVMIKPYPQSPYMDQPDLNDTYTGVDRQMWKDTHGRTLKKGYDTEKY